MPGPNRTALALLAFSAISSAQAGSKPPAGVSGRGMTQASGTATDEVRGDARGRGDLELARARPQGGQGGQQDRADDLARAADDEDAPAPFFVLALLMLGQGPAAQQGGGQGNDLGLFGLLLIWGRWGHRVPS